MKDKRKYFKELICFFTGHRWKKRTDGEDVKTYALGNDWKHCEFCGRAVSVKKYNLEEEVKR